MKHYQITNRGWQSYSYYINEYVEPVDVLINRKFVNILPTHSLINHTTQGTLKIKKLLIEKNVFFNLYKDKDRLYYFVVYIDSLFIKLDLKSDRFFAIVKDSNLKFVFNKFNLIFGSNKVSIKGDNNLIEVLI